MSTVLRDWTQTAAALRRVGDDVSQIMVHLDQIAERFCPVCRSTIGELVVASRRCLELARSTLDEGSLGAHRGTLGLVRLADRFADFVDAQDTLQRAFGIRIELTHNVSEDCAVISNRALGKHITQKLIENAAKAGASRMRIHYEEMADHVEVVFADDGRGMSPAELDSLGLNINDANVAGGLGVRLVRRLVNQGGGMAHWESRPGIGTWVTIRLLKHDSSKSRSQTVVATGESQDLGFSSARANEVKAASVLHDVSNDLATVKIHLDLIDLRACSKCKPAVRPLVHRAITAASTVKKELALVSASPGSGGLSVVCLRDRFEDIERFRPELESSYGIEIKLTHNVSEDCAVIGNREGGMRAIKMLMDHAARSRAKSVHIHYEEHDDFVQVVFADDGCGMTAAELNALDFTAVGGIDEMRRMIARAGGTVSWDSRKNIGSWVTIRLRKYRPV